METIKWVLIGIAILFVVIFIIGIIIGNYFHNRALKMSTVKKIKDSKQKHIDAMHPGEKELEWFNEEGKYDEVELDSYDGLKLHGYAIRNEQFVDTSDESFYMKSENNVNIPHKWAIVVHGYSTDATHSLKPAMKFYEMGYNILLPDLRAHGKSKGEYTGMGWLDRRDLMSWINYIVALDIDSEICLYGISMGAATVMLACGEELPTNVKIAVEDCGYTSVWEQFKYLLKKNYKLPSFPILHFSSFVIKIRRKFSCKKASCLKALENRKVPMLFIHGEEDDFVPFDMLEELYDVSSDYNAPKQKLVIPGAKHAEAQIEDKRKYWETIDEFLAKYGM